jgi:multiple sugar transport system substrate-binding protein
MGYGGNKQGSVTRRHFLKTTSAIAGAAGLAPALSAPFVSTALAQTKTLKVIQWSHFVPQFDTWFDGFAKDWGKKNGITVTIDHIPHLEEPARAAAEVAAGAGHDLIMFNGFGGPHLFEKHLADLTGLVEELEKKYGKVQPIGRQIAYNEGTKTWSAFPDYYISFPGLYRKDLWDEIGMKPETWEDLRVGGAKLKAKGNPVGIGLGHSVDPNVSYRSILWSYGASECDESGKNVTLNSKQTLEAVKFVRALYKEAMEPEVLSWDDASNNRYLASGRASWIRIGRQDLRLENPGWTGAPAGRQLAQFLRDLAVCAQQGHGDRVPAPLRRPWGRGFPGEHRLQPPAVRQPRASAHADPVG